MRRISILGAAALLAVVPAATRAQSTPTTSSEVVVKESTTVVVKEAPKPSPVTFTPYGFLLLNAFFNDSPGLRIFPLPSPCTGGASCEGNVIFNVAQTRLGSRLAFNDTAGWTGATLSALVEIDFKGGYAGAVPTGSAAFYNPVIRLRKAYVDAGWGTESRIVLRIGQDDRIISPLRGVSLAYVADPVFQYAGAMNGRAPMIALRYDRTPKNGLGAAVTLAALNPQDTTVGDNGVSPNAAIDLGAGNRSRIPAFEGRIGVGWLSNGKKVVDVGGWFGWQKDRFVNPSTDTNLDIASYIFGGDLTVNVSMFQLLGQIAKGYGYDVPGTLGASQGVAISYAPPPTPIPAGYKFTLTGANAVPAFSGWFQLSARPIEALQVYGGWGGTQSPADAYNGSVFATGNFLTGTGAISPAQATAATRLQNFMWAAGVIGYAGKNWRFSAEYGRSTSFFLNGASFSQGQFSLNSQLVF